MSPISVRALRWLAAALFAALWVGATAAAPWVDKRPRVAIMSAFAPELDALMPQVRQVRRHRIHGVEFTTGVLRGRRVVLFLSGISMTNAAMNTQLALDHFRVTHLLVSGIAGGVDPSLRIGDVSVPERWGQYLEMLLAREVAPGRYAPPPWMDDVQLPNFGMIHPRPVEFRGPTGGGLEKRFWFDADPRLLAVARRLSAVELARCDARGACLSVAPALKVGGHGVSGSAFVDNAAFREYSFRTFEARVLDMETAAAAMVAHANGVPFLAFRSLSDLAGGGEGENEIETFLRIAAENSARVLVAFLDAWR